MSKELSKIAKKVASKVYRLIKISATILFGSVALITTIGFIVQEKESKTLEKPNSQRELPATFKEETVEHNSNSLKTIELEFQAERGKNGEVFIVGSTSLPDGMKLGVELRGDKEYYAQQLSIIVKNGKFISRGFTNRGMMLKAGKFKVEVLSYLTPVWQKKSILEYIENSMNIDSPIVFKKEPELIDSDLVLRDIRTLQFPGLSPEHEAISLVKSAVITIPNKGTSSKNIKEALDYYLNAVNLLEPGRGWSARKKEGNLYHVEFDYLDSSKHLQAIWNANLKTKEVKYRNKAAKVFGYTR